MAYENGSATDSVDLITKMKDFSVAQGWTLDSFTTEGTGRRFHIHKGSDMYFNFRLYVNEVGINGAVAHSNAIFVNGSTGYSGASPWYGQANAPSYTDGSTFYGNAGMVELDGSIPNYHFFAFTGSGYDALYFIVEYPAGIYQWMLMGRLDKTNYGTSTGGQFFTSMRRASNVSYQAPLNFFGKNPNFISSHIPEGYIYVDNTGGSSPKWAWSDHFIPAVTLAAPRCFDSVRKTSSIWNDMPNTFNSLPPLIPVTVGVYVDGNNYAVTTPWSPIGELPNLYWCVIKTLNPGSSFNIASDQYKAFPFFKKSDLTYNGIDPFNYGSQYYGFAIKSN